MHPRTTKLIIAAVTFIGLLWMLSNPYSYDFDDYANKQQHCIDCVSGQQKGAENFPAEAVQPTATSILVTKKNFTQNRHEPALTFEETPGSKCRLPQLDPWDLRVLPYLFPNWNPLKGCTVSRVMHTELKNGQLRVLDHVSSHCKYRCLHADGEMNFVGSSWIQMKKKIAYPVNCDFVETHCKNGYTTTFRYIHVQVIKPKQKWFQKEDEQHPGVFFLVLDSVSSSSGMRAIMETNQVLRQFYDATTFYYHNVVGDSSRANAFGMFSGSRLTELTNGRYFPGKSAPERPNSCKEGVVKNESVTYEFINQSYASLIADDWVGVFSSFKCKGYGEPPGDHYGGPLILRSTGDKSVENQNEFDVHFYKGECQDRYHKIMDFVDKFLIEYEGISKFALIWLSKVAHDSPSGLYRSDKYLADFFRKHVNRLKNSFIFVLGDHGMRFTAIRQTVPGALESFNPFLTIALPKYLRSNEQLILNLKRNSRRHTSQYDIYATLYDIARYARNGNFQKWDEHDFRTEFGEIRGGIRARSLLRPIRHDRSCEEMEIPEEFCICMRNWRAVDLNNKNVIKAAQALIMAVNDHLKRKKVDGLCAMLNLTKVNSAEYLEEERMMKIMVTASPSNGKYEAYLLNEGGRFKLMTKVSRLDGYVGQGFCIIAEDITPLCFCRSILIDRKG